MDSLPPELVTQILEYLPYYDLKLRIPLVCKRFKGILEAALKAKHGKIAQNLFIDEVIPDNTVVFIYLTPPYRKKGIVPCNDLALNPILSKITYDFSYAPDNLHKGYRVDLHNCNPNLDGFRINGHRLFDYESLLSENVFSPAFPGFSYYFNAPHDAIGILMDKCKMHGPLKIKALLTWYKMRIDIDMREIQENQRAGVEEDLSGEELSYINEILRDTFKWNGSLKIGVDGDGYLHLLVLNRP